MQILETVDTPYNQIDVCLQADGTVDLDVTGATHATWHPSKLLTGHAWDAITAASMFAPTMPRSFLLLGLGGGTVVRQLSHLCPGLKGDAVEIDPEMLRIARTYMHLPEQGITIHLMDAKRFLEDPPTNQTFDLVIDDLYRCGDDDVERPFTFDEAHVECLHSFLNPRGVLVANFVLGEGHRRQHSLARRAFLSHFEVVRTVRPPLSYNESIVGGYHLQAPRHVRRLWREFSNPHDQQRWKELRTLPLR